MPSDKQLPKVNTVPRAGEMGLGLGLGLGVGMKRKKNPSAPLGGFMEKQMILVRGKRLCH